MVSRGERNITENVRSNVFICLSLTLVAGDSSVCKETLLRNLERKQFLVLCLINLSGSFSQHGGSCWYHLILSVWISNYSFIGFITVWWWLSPPLLVLAPSKLKYNSYTLDNLSFLHLEKFKKSNVFFGEISGVQGSQGFSLGTLSYFVTFSTILFF